MACVYDGGVAICADSRVSTGTYVSNRASDKITPLWENVYLLRSGSAADTQVVSDYGAHPCSILDPALEGMGCSGAFNLLWEPCNVPLTPA